jgi:hypothetical protein
LHQASVKRRFFVLRSNLEMAYFNSDSPCGAGVDQIGIIKLREATGVSSESELGFVIDTPGRQWRLEAESAQEQQAWITLVSQIVTKQHPLTKHTFSVRKCGWLTKRGQIVENFKRRYVCLFGLSRQSCNDVNGLSCKCGQICAGWQVRSILL